LLIFQGYLNLLLGFIFLLIPIIFIELARPKDLFKAGLLFLSGISLILQYDNFDDETLLIFLINGLITYIFLIEIFSVRWNQLSLKEKNQLATLKEISGKFQIFFNVIRITFQRIFTKSLIVDTVKKTSTAKKWVRKANKDELSPLTDDGFISSQSTNNPKKDIID
tara:strand:+ start:126 stop:623 length:498 start_codon:yes stop_codon:yes gene_type:complete